MKIYFRYIVLFIFTILLFYSCGKSKSEESSADFFLFDKTKLGISVSDQELGVRFNSPKNWELTPASLSKKIESRNNLSDTFIYQPVYVFFDDSTGSLLSVGKVTPTDTLMSAGARLNYYKNMLSSKYKDQNFSLNYFVHSKITFNQIRFQKENLVSLRVLFQNQKMEIVQFDYSIRKELFLESELFIKASIGSIKLL